MEDHKSQYELQSSSPQTSKPVSSSCRMKKSEEASFLADLRDHIDEFVHASVDEHKSCFNKTIRKMFGMSKAVAEKNSENNGVISFLPLETTSE